MMANDRLFLASFFTGGGVGEADGEGLLRGAGGESDVLRTFGEGLLSASDDSPSLDEEDDDFATSGDFFR